LIELIGVSKTFKGTGQKVEAVQDVTINVAEKEIMGIIGYSGAGKSTLVRLINLLEHPDSGKVIIDGNDLTVMSPKELRTERKKIGMIFQNFNLMSSRTVFGNIAYPLEISGLNKNQITARVDELLELVDISDKRESWLRELSGGQKQRVAIARALANYPKILLCDEATSSLDPQTTKSILKLLQKLNETLGLTIVVITHEMGVVKEICHKVAVMEGGKVVEEGDVFTVFSNPQQKITKDFISTTSNLSRIYELLEEKSPVVALKETDLLVKLKFVERSVSEPLISGTSRQFNVDFNILFSDMEILQDAALGGIISIVSGERDKVEAAMTYLREKNVQIDIIADGKNS